MQQKDRKDGPEHERRIMHLDMDAFFASIEQVDNPKLKGLPVIVGGSSDRGVVSAASYEARKYGVHSAMPVVQARKLCPRGVFLPVRMKRYAQASRQVMDILAQVSPLVEKASVDEAYVDITGTGRLLGPPRELAVQVKRQVLETTSLTCSIGIAPNKFLAKIASDFDKPDGLTVIEPEAVADFLAGLPVGKIPGVGKRTLEILEGVAVRTAGDVLKYPRSFWSARLGKGGESLFRKAQGIDTRPVVISEAAKSCSAEHTFEQDTDDRERLRQWLLKQSERVGRELRQDRIKGRTVTLKVKYADHHQITRSRTLARPTNSTDRIFETVSELLEGVELKQKVRLVGTGVSNFAAPQVQLTLLEEGTQEEREALDSVLDCIRSRFGDHAIKRGRLFGEKKK